MSLVINKVEEKRKGKRRSKCTQILRTLETYPKPGASGKPQSHELIAQHLIGILALRIQDHHMSHCTKEDELVHKALLQAIFVKDQS
jgi:hypothetical protein